MVFNNNLLLGSSGQSTGQASFDSTLIGNSIWLDGSADFLNRQNGSDFSNRKEVTLSFWVQRNEFGDGTINTQQAIFAGLESSTGFIIQFTGDDTFQLHLDGSANLTTNAVFRDIAWYHILVSIDTSQAASFNRSKVYINGEQITSFSSSAYPSQDSNIPGISGQMTSSENMRIGNYNNAVSNFYFWNGYIAQACMIESKSIQQGDFAVSDFLDTFTFGTNGSQIIPKKDSDIAALASAAGGNSFCLDFSDSSGTDAANLGNDIANNNDFTPTSMAAANQSTHTPSRTYLQLNPLQKFGTADLSEGNTRVGVDVSDSIRGTKYATTGKKYLEVTLNTVNNSYIGVANGSNNPSSFASSNVACLQKDGDIYINDSPLGSGRSKTFTTGDVVGILIDADAKKFWQSVNGTFNSLDRNSSITLSASDILAGTGGFDLSGLTGDDGNYVLHIGNSDGTSADVSINGGHKSFSHTPPTGYTGWASDDYTAPDFQGIDYFDATLYEGNGGVQRVGDFVPFTDVYTVDNSAMFDYDDKRYLSFTPDSGGNQKTFTFSFWFKLTGLSDPSYVNGVLSTAATKTAEISFRSSGSLKPNDQQIRILLYTGSSFVANLTTDRAFAATDGWTHAVIAFDTRTGVAAANKIKIYINGVLQTTTGTQLSTDDYDTNLNANTEHQIGRQKGSGIGEADAYFAEMVMVEDQQLDPTSFGQVDTSTNRWVPKDVSGLTFGSEGWYLEFDGTAFGSGGSGETPANGAGKDSSGNNNHWEEENNGGSDWSTSDQFVDTPSKNFNVFDHGLNGVGTLSQGNTQIVTTTDQKTTYTTMNIPATGKWYWEVDVVNYVTGGSVYLGVVEFDELVTGNPITGLTKQVIFDNFAGNAYIYSNQSSDNLGTTWCNTPGNNNFNADGDILQFALDQDAGTLFIGNNNTWFRAGGSRDSFANATTVGQLPFKTGVKRRFLIGRGGSFNETYAINFGQQANTFSGSSTTFNAAADGFFVYTPPTGYKALNQDNLDDTASKLTALSLIKNRDADDDLIWQDRVMGASGFLSTTRNTAGTSGISSIGDGGNDLLTTNANMAQRFLQRGVQVGNDDAVNTSGESYVLWQWLLGESATTGSSITTGSPDMATTGIVSDANHFSIVQYTGNGSAGASFAHGLGSKPELVIIKRITGSTTNSDWVASTQGLGLADNNYFFLHYNLGVQTSSNQIRTGDITNDLVIVGNGPAVNVNTQTHQAYCFRSVPGLCKVGSFTSANAQDGSYISLGFKPRWILIKRADSTARDWQILDTARSPINTAKLYLETNRRQAEATATNTANFFADFLSDGFKIRTNSSVVGGDPMIYLAMAEIGGNGTLPPIYGR